MPLALEMRSLTFAAGAFALQNVDLRVPIGVLCALLGPSGSGKSLLLKLLLGLETPDFGERLIFGRDLATDQPPVRLAYLPQSRFLHNSMTVQEALRFTTLVSGESYVDFQTVEAVLAAVNLTVNPRTYVGELNTSQQRRLLLAKLLIHQPHILLLDDPAASLMGDERQDFLRLLRDISATRTVCYTTSVPADARAASDWLALLHAGQLVAQGASAELFENADYAEYLLTIRGDCETVHQLLVEQAWIHSIDARQDGALSRWTVRVHDEHKAEHGLLRAILADRNLHVIDFRQSIPRLRGILADMEFIRS